MFRGDGSAKQDTWGQNIIIKNLPELNMKISCFYTRVSAFHQHKFVSVWRNMATFAKTTLL